MRGGSLRVTSIAIRYVKYSSPSIRTGRAPLRSSSASRSTIAIAFAARSGDVSAALIHCDDRSPVAMRREAHYLESGRAHQPDQLAHRERAGMRRVAQLFEFVVVRRALGLFAGNQILDATSPSARHTRAISAITFAGSAK